MRVETIRAEVIRMTRQQPFRPFEINIENGDRLVIEHPENIAFNPNPEQKKFPNRFHVLNGDFVYVSTFDAVSSVAAIDSGQVVNGDSQ